MTRTGICAGNVPLVVGCALLTMALAAVDLSSARAQDVFSGGGNTAPSPSSGKTGTQGVNGNPFCPPPVIIVNGVATTPRNWSCRGDEQSYRKPSMPKGQISPGYDGEYQCTRSPPMPKGQISPGYDSEYRCTRRDTMPKGQISPGYASEYHCTRREPMPAGKIGTGYDTAYQCTHSTEVRTAPGVGFSVQINR